VKHVALVYIKQLTKCLTIAANVNWLTWTFAETTHESYGGLSPPSARWHGQQASLVDVWIFKFLFKDFTATWELPVWSTRLSPFNEAAFLAATPAGSGTTPKQLLNEWVNCLQLIEDWQLPIPVTLQVVKHTPLIVWQQLPVLQSTFCTKLGPIAERYTKNRWEFMYSMLHWYNLIRWPEWFFCLCVCANLVVYFNTATYTIRSFWMSTRFNKKRRLKQVTLFA